VAQCMWSKGQERLVEKGQYLVLSTVMEGLGSWMSSGKFLPSQTECYFHQASAAKTWEKPLEQHTDGHIYRKRQGIPKYE